jgi:type I restriction enzyme S subunit
MSEETARLFPEGFEDSPLGPIPKGWRSGTFGDFSRISRDAVAPSDSPLEVFDHYSIPAFDEGQQPKREPGSAIKSNKFIVPAQAVLVSKLNPEIPRVWLPWIGAPARAYASHWVI